MGLMLVVFSTGMLVLMIRCIQHRPEWAPISAHHVATRGDDNIAEYLNFPPDFKLGTSTSAYQIEGAWNISDKGPSVWDKFTHENPTAIYNNSNGDVACDSYNKYKEDLVILKDLGVDFYRISLSWSRILPTGFSNQISDDGIRYYKNLLDDLNALGIEPAVTIYHWDHPAVLEKMGGWTNDKMVTWFADYARVIFEELGDRIKIFATMNEPNINCLHGYGSDGLAPGKKLPGVGPYLCMHNALKAHAKVYKMYDNIFRKSQGGQIGIVVSCFHHYPKSINDTETQDVQFAFECGWVTDPIFSKNGDYPAIMKRRIAENSKLEGYDRSRLPEFTKTEINYIRGTADYLGLNHYSSVVTESAPKSLNTLWYQDTGVITSYNAIWPDTISTWLKIVPQGFGDVLRKLKNLYGNPPIYVLENGIADDGKTLLDHQRVKYLHDYLRELLIAINRDDCNVKRYASWSFMDSFEWAQGYRERFGLVSVDFANPSRPRTPKLSYSWYQRLIRTRMLPSIDFSENEI